MKTHMCFDWLLCAGALFVATTGLATPITYTSSTAFYAALGATATVEGYEAYGLNSTISNGTVLNGVSYDQFPAGTVGRISGIYHHFAAQSLALQRGTDSRSYFLPTEQLSISFTTPVYALGVFFNVNIVPARTLYISTPVGTATTGGSVYDQSKFYFVGLISDTPFTTAFIGSKRRAHAGYNLDNLTFWSRSTSSVPDTGSTCLLLLLGVTAIIGLNFLLRKRLGTSVGTV